jgi:hypothetical protein
MGCPLFYCVAPEPLTFEENRCRAPAPCFKAFSLCEPRAVSLEKTSTEVAVASGFEHSSAGWAEFGPSYFQAFRDPIDVGDGLAAETEGVSRASVLLFLRVGILGRRDAGPGDSSKNDQANCKFSIHALYLRDGLSAPT